jgi:hypothetical protein
MIAGSLVEILNPRLLFVPSRSRLVILTGLDYITRATAFRQLKRTVVVPTRMVRAWFEQPTFHC